MIYWKRLGSDYKNNIIIKTCNILQNGVFQMLRIGGEKDIGGIKSTYLAKAKALEPTI